MKKTKKKPNTAPPLVAPDLGLREAALAMVWLDYCAQCFEKQLRLWRRAAKLHRDAASRGSVRYHEEGLKAIRWCRGHLEQCVVSRGWAAGPQNTTAALAESIQALWAEYKL